MNSVTIEPELNSLLSKLTVEIESDSKEIDLLKKRIEKNEALLRAVRASLGAYHPKGELPGYGAKSQAILDAISRLQRSQFTQDDVQKEIERLHPGIELNRNRIRAALWTLAVKQKRIRTVSRGNNRNPTVYQKMQAFAVEAPAATSELNAPIASSPGPYAGLTQWKAIEAVLTARGPTTSRDIFDALATGGKPLKRRTDLSALLSRNSERLERTDDGKYKLRA